MRVQVHVCDNCAARSDDQRIPNEGSFVAVTGDRLRGWLVDGVLFERNGYGGITQKNGDLCPKCTSAVFEALRVARLPPQERAS